MTLVLCQLGVSSVSDTEQVCEEQKLKYFCKLQLMPTKNGEELCFSNDI